MHICALSHYQSVCLQRFLAMSGFFGIISGEGLDSDDAASNEVMSYDVTSDALFGSS